MVGIDRVPICDRLETRLGSERLTAMGYRIKYICVGLDRCCDSQRTTMSPAISHHVRTTEPADRLVWRSVSQGPQLSTRRTRGWPMRGKTTFLRRPLRESIYSHLVQEGGQRVYVWAVYCRLGILAKANLRRLARVASPSLSSW